MKNKQHTPALMYFLTLLVLSGLVFSSVVEPTWSLKQHQYLALKVDGSDLKYVNVLDLCEKLNNLEISNNKPLTNCADLHEIETRSYYTVEIPESSGDINKE